MHFILLITVAIVYLSCYNYNNVNIICNFEILNIKHSIKGVNSMDFPTIKYLDKDIMHFKYIIITPNEKEQMVTYFNRFDQNISKSINYLELISMLPIDLYELYNEWPISANNYESTNNYSVQYINESILNEKLIKYISTFLWSNIHIGRSFRTDYFKFNKFGKMPIITFEKFDGCLQYDPNMFEVIYKYWETSTDTLLDDQSNNKQKILSLFKHKDFTTLKGIDTYSAHFLNPLSRGINRLRGIYLKQSEKTYVCPSPI